MRQGAFFHAPLVTDFATSGKNLVAKGQLKNCGISFELKPCVKTEDVMSRLIWALLLAFQIIASPAVAERIEVFSHKAWGVYYHPAEGNFEGYCSGETENRAGQLFNIVAYAGGSIRMFFFDHGWSIPKRTLTFVVDVDYNRWEMVGTGEKIAISLQLNGNDKAVEFLDDVSSGSAVALYNTELRRLAIFSLSGSKAALLKLLECKRAIAGADADPFRTQKDPF